jgi:hypothetical protein
MQTVFDARGNRHPVGSLKKCPGMGELRDFSRRTMFAIWLQKLFGPSTTPRPTAKLAPAVIDLSCHPGCLTLAILPRPAAGAAIPGAAVQLEPWEARDLAFALWRAARIAEQANVTVAEVLSTGEVSGQ